MAFDLRGETESRAWATGATRAHLSLSGTPPSSAPTTTPKGSSSTINNQLPNNPCRPNRDRSTQDQSPCFRVVTGLVPSRDLRWAARSARSRTGSQRADVMIVGAVYLMRCASLSTRCASRPCRRQEGRRCMLASLTVAVHAGRDTPYRALTPLAIRRARS
jgi:hypothetical protein